MNLKKNLLGPTTRILGYVLALGILLATIRVLPIHYTFNIYEFPRNNTTYTLYYKVAVFTMDYIADSNDTVHLHIDSHGGVVLSGLDMANAALRTDAHTIAHINSGAYSAGAIVAVACDEIKAERYSTILFHKARIGSLVIDHYAVDLFLTEKVVPYLTKEEADKMFAGEDIEIPGQEFAERFNNKVKLKSEKKTEKTIRYILDLRR